MDSVGEGEGGEIWGNGTETCIISCMKQVTSPGSMHDTGCLGLVHWDDPEGGYGEGGGKEKKEKREGKKKGRQRERRGKDEVSNTGSNKETGSGAWEPATT